MSLEARRLLKPRTITDLGIKFVSFAASKEKSTPSPLSASLFAFKLDTSTDNARGLSALATPTKSAPNLIDKESQLGGWLF